MALFKPIKQENGIVTNYHRIMFVESWANSHISIAVLSYIDKDMRDEETENSEIYKISKTYETNYVENMTVDKAYEYLKSLPEFEGSEDI